MATEEFTIAELRKVLRESAGQTEGIDLEGDILDVAFDALGYDSLALLETARRIETSRAVVFDDSMIVDATTPRALLTVVNERLAAGHAA
ncbi:acyl carrier protein [Amycolatopsis nigrescens]|uniref:acyl carrier protein n=1 Tax=Amycolatopsis nigrescens TaxID=381445 RepID=UPI000379779E|nr:acyl carrier protein [Amycolatopsis nigrescens]